ncbi:ATP-binding protein [uncultured Kordia sp.]|uniref:ATP-binding protein n=1 Tax=uncultured Kordia sp. TaxID=507699 RepID=UPI0026162412|nr:ATP-binding protein [uncultured Kordia sp.]
MAFKNIENRAVKTILSLLPNDEINAQNIESELDFVLQHPDFNGQIDRINLLKEVNRKLKTTSFKAKSHILSLLGDELIGSDSLAIFELVKNSYDADAEKVKISFIDLNTNNQKIIIEDDGQGMNYDKIKNIWLTIGTDFKRGRNRKVSDVFERVSFGNKGVGRLAVHKLAKIASLETQYVGEKHSHKLTIDWQKLIESKDYIQELEVEINKINGSLFEKGHGTRIILSELTSKSWTKKSLKDLARKIENIKNPFAEFPDFEVLIECNDFHQQWIDEVTSAEDNLDDSLYQFEFEISKHLDDNTNSYLDNDFAVIKWSYFFNPPVQTKLRPNRIPQNDSKFIENNFHIGKIFEEIEGSDTYNKYLRNKDLSNIGKIKGKFFVYNQNSSLLKMRFGGQINAIKSYIRNNCGVKVYRDDIRVYNYGEPFDDWLGLDLDKIQRMGDHFGKKVSIGAVELDLDESIDGLIEKTNREGFIDNIYYKKFRVLIREVFRFFESEALVDKEKIDEYIDSTKPIKKVGFGDTIKELQSKIKEKDLEKELSPLLKRVDKDYTEMRDIMVNSGMTGLNLGVAFHEVEREMNYINNDLKQSDIDIEDVKIRVNNLIQILENLSPILRQNKNRQTSAKFIVEKARNINKNRFGYHNAIFSSPLITEENPNFNFKAPTSLLISAISNLIDNSIYWTTSKRDLEGEEFKPGIFIGSDLNSFDGPAIIVADNGNGFSIEPEFLTQPFKTKREGGMGLGLYFTDLVMNMIGGKLIFPDSLDLNIPKVYDGACVALVFPNK